MSRGGRMSRASTSRSGRSGNPNVAGSNLDLAVFEPWSSETNDFKSDTCRSLSWYSALLGLGKDWLALCQDNTTEWVLMAWCSSEAAL